MTHTHLPVITCFASKHNFLNHHHHPFPLYNYIFPKGKLDFSEALILCHIKDFTSTEVSVLL